MPFVQSTYRAPPWLPHQHLETIYPATLLKPARTGYIREEWRTPDGDFIEVDWLVGLAHRPLVILFHGLEGSSQSHYALALTRHLRQLGWRAVIPHFRGCGGKPNQLARAYHAGDSAEIHWVLRRIAHLFPDVPRFAVGVSLGGNALLKWLGEEREYARDYLTAAAALSAPLDLAAAGNSLDHGFNQAVYTRYFLRSLRPKNLDKASRFPLALDWLKGNHARTFREFDDSITAPLHGFAHVEDYWTRASAKPFLPHIALPTLVLNARNDPFLPAQYLPTAAEVSAQVTLEQPERGGHIGFVSGAFPGHLRWIPERLTGFFSPFITTAQATPAC
jgi:predicted alpha/beta-fold hydrolase